MPPHKFSEPLPWYSWFPLEYRASRKVQRMGYLARGLYRELLDEQWREGSIPHDIAALAEICDCPEDVMAAEWPKIAPCFAETEDGQLVNAKLERQRTEDDEYRAQQARNGRKGGRPKSTTETQPLTVETHRLTTASGGKPVQNSTEEKSTKEKSTEDKSKIDNLDASMVVSAVMLGAGVGGMKIRVALEDVVGSAMKSGMSGEQVHVQMVRAWQDYKRLSSEGKLSQYATPSPERFFGDGLWKDRALWKYKENGPQASWIPTASRYAKDAA